MNHKGFSKIASPKKSLRQELRQVFGKFNKRGKARYSPLVLHEISRIESHDGKVHQIIGDASTQNELLQDDTCFEHSHRHDSEIQALDNHQGLSETFPLYTLPCREDFEQSHWQEWGESAIDSEIAALNFKSLSGNAAFDYLLYSDKISRRNDGRLRDGDMRRYAHLDNGGWWCSGIDILTCLDSLWGCLKSNTPRTDADNSKAIKYEHPPKVDTEIFALRIPTRIWELIGRRYDVALPENYQSLPYGYFWRWVKENTQISVIICEGAKKAAAILSCGYVAIGIPGVWGGCRQPKDEYGQNSGAPYLIPQLEVFAQPGRRIHFCFDSDVKRTTVRSVNSAITKTAKLFSWRGCEVRVMRWHSVLGKGVDDVIAACGRDQLDTIYCDAQHLEQWNTKQLRRLTYIPDLSLKQRYLGELAIPSDKQLIVLKSPKNTGKTYFFEWITDPVIRSGQKGVLVITHRVQLGTQIVNKLGLPFITEVREAAEGSDFGMGLCIDSLHPKSQAKFNPDEWKGCWLILDEIMQLIWHLLSSSTCQSDRVAIIKNFKRLLQNVVNYGGKIFIADADLSDIGIDFIKGLIGQEVDTFIVENTFKFVEPWQVNLVQGTNPAQLVKILTQKLENGEKCLVCLSGQRASSRWGSRNLEAYYRKLFPKLRILRIDSKTVENPKHPAYGCVRNINQVIRDNDWWEKNTCPINACPLPLPSQKTGENVSGKLDQYYQPSIFQLPTKSQETDEEVSVPYKLPSFSDIFLRDCLDYDLVLTTPTIETGVSIEEKHFDYVFGIFQGVQTTDSVRQYLSRYRPPVPRYIWLNPVGLNRVGNGSSSVKALLAGEYRKNKANIKKLVDFGFEESIEGNYESICINTWAKLGAIINHGMNSYSKQIISDLKDEGHIICEVSADELSEPTEVEATKEEIYNNCKEEYTGHCESITASESITDEEFLKLDKQNCKTEEQQLQHRKGEIERRYSVIVTPDLVEKDDKNWYSLIRLHYFLSRGREFLPDREKNIMSTALKNGDGDYFIPDTNKSLICKKIDALDFLKFHELMQVKEISNNHKLAIELLTIIKKYSYDFKLLLGVNFSKVKTPMEACQRLAAMIGYKFPILRKEGKRGEQVRIYGTPAPSFKKDDEGNLVLVNGQAVPISDRRDEIFTAWVERDTLAREKAAADKLEAQKAIIPEVLKVEEVTSVEVGQDLTIEQVIPAVDYTGAVVEQSTLPALQQINLDEIEVCESQVSEQTDSHSPLRVGLKLKLKQGLQDAGRFYQEAVLEIGEAIGVADGKPFWNAYLSRWHIAVNFACGCKSIAYDWVVIA